MLWKAVVLGWTFSTHLFSETFPHSSVFCVTESLYGATWFDICHIILDEPISVFVLLILEIETRPQD